MVDSEHDPFNVAWCRSHFAMMANGGVWGVPRSGLVFTKRGEELVLTDKMPYMEEMPITPAQLEEQQQADFETIRDHFKVAGITVKEG